MIMFDMQMKPYEMINVMDENCPVCEGFGRIYNFENSGYEFLAENGSAGDIPDTSY
ncbi:hypothetical protein SAMN04515679_2874 [Pelosinus fermentans]|jgi:hypothetical protein|uniref:Uncharacterized protein n=1 Tax=Pelosinus fermentans B4 TaxID=1149862 RepID=I9LBS6_9FIRM|nr:hypothetical protein FB4_3897 [Pelosinus fermentans B4]EIW23816.1 hypothetical protein FA11_3899 [Pelosinus fermentans A11]OAM94739.1 hypothetical protein FR7_02759 [Pelosinus fermentans DSM 17108]SDR16502.1 hypothetical protein SAMN04515679_2874 [Pelosinus fermentans]